MENIATAGGGTGRANNERKDPPSPRPPSCSSPPSASPSQRSPGGSGRASPPPDCAICLGQCKNKSYTDCCLHQFCFHCLLTWSKIKPECPLCKQGFKSIIHNVKSNHQYEEYMVEQQRPPPDDFFEEVYNDTPRFRYRTTLTLHRHEGLALERLLLRYPLVPLGAPSQGSSSPPVPTLVPLDALPSWISPPSPPPARHARRSRPGLFRQSVYRHNLWAQPLPDITGRHRECSPEFYRHNPAQIHRLVPWLTRELTFLIPNSPHVLSRILDTLTVCPILSPPFRQMLTPYLNIYTAHFLHEFYSFASSPFDMVGYDCAVQYQPGGNRVQENFVNEVLSSSDGENSTDSDIVMLSLSAGPSNAFPVPFAMNPPAEPGTSNRALGSLSNPVIAIETMSYSDTEDSSDEVVMVGYIKPPHERTPEVVDLLASDSDTVIIEEPRVSSPIEVVDERSLPMQAAPASGSVAGPAPTLAHCNSTHASDQPSSSSGFVKLSLKRNRQPRSASVDSDSEEDVNYDRNRSKRAKNKHFKKNKPVSRDSASTECTDRDTDYSDADYTPNSLSLSSSVSVSQYSHTDGSSVSSVSAAPSSPESAARTSGKRVLSKSKQSLACQILKKFKMNLRNTNKRSQLANLDRSADSDVSYRDSDSEEKPVAVSDASTAITAASSSDRRKLKKKFKHRKKKVSDAPSDQPAKPPDSQKLKYKSRSKSKERLITKIFENKQNKNNKGKTGMSSKSKAKNKCFVKSSTRNVVDINSPSTSAGASTSRVVVERQGSVLCRTNIDHLQRKLLEPRSPHTGSSPTNTGNSNLLDIVSKTILSPKNPVLSINESSSGPGPGSGPAYVNEFSHDISTLLNQLNDNFFSSSNTGSPNPKPLNLSSSKGMDNSLG